MDYKKKHSYKLVLNIHCPENVSEFSVGTQFPGSCSFTSLHQNTYHFTTTEQKAPDNSEDHTSLQNF